MIPKLIKSVLLLLIIQMLLPVRVALADTGPKPEMEFEFQQEMTGDQLTIVSGILYECEQPDCSGASPLEELGPQRFSCDLESCYAMAYGFSQYHMLEIQFSDGVTRQSNIFETAGFESRYLVTVRPQDLLVEAHFSLGAIPRTATILAACLCGLFFVVLLAGLVIFMMRRRSKN